MPSRQIALRLDEPPALREGLRRLRAELGIPGRFSAGVLAEAEAAASAPVLPERDLTDIGFITLDPAGSTDLDQAFHLSRRQDGFLLRYAIADVAAFVRPGGAIDTETHSRGETYYAPTHRTPLHPEVLSEGATSLLAGQERSALVWELELDADGLTTSARVARARVRSRRQWAYAEAQAALDAGTADPQFELLRIVGGLRQQQEAARGGVSLPVPEQEVVTTGRGWQLAFRGMLPIENWNAQLSLATGMAAAAIMLEGGQGILRTLPPARDSGLAKLRRTAAALGIRWSFATDYPTFVRSLDASDPRQAAMLNACMLLYRGAGYQAFHGTPPEQAEHAAIAAPYAHCTAPLRRLVDRYTGELCVALCAGAEVPEWVAEALPSLPGEMEQTGRRGKKYERGIVDLVEAMVLAPRLGETFTGTVLEVDPDDGDGVLQLQDPAVEAVVKGGDLSLGEEVRATLVAADLLSGAVRFAALS